MGGIGGDDALKHDDSMVERDGIQTPRAHDGTKLSGQFSRNPKNQDVQADSRTMI